MRAALRPTYQVRPYEAKDLGGVLTLLGDALAGGPTGTRSGALYRWKHEANPFGPSLALVAEDGGEIVGLRTFLRWRFLAGDRPVQAVRAVDTATRSGYRGQGIFTSLTRAALEQLRGSAEFVFNTPNGSSLPGYRKLGWQQAGKVPVALRPVRPLRFTAGLPGARRGAPGGPPPPSPLPRAADVLHERAAACLLEEAAPGGRVPAGGLLATRRTPDYLRWRYVAVPGLDYRAVTVEEGGRLTGLGIARTRRRGRLAELVLAEVLTRPGDVGAARQVLRSAARSGCDHVAAHLAPGSPARRAARGTGYLAPPGVGMVLAVKPLAPVRPDPADLRSWYLSLGDLEVF